CGRGTQILPRFLTIDKVKSSFQIQKNVQPACWEMLCNIPCRIVLFVINLISSVSIAAICNSHPSSKQ
ncbi:hypothetical protein T265_15842, partial [Opisthorchis viverrini]